MPAPRQKKLPIFHKSLFWACLLLGFLTCSASAFQASSQTAIRIEGLVGLTEEEVLSRLAGRLDFITSRPPSRSRADDADFLVSSLLEKEGYSDVTISWKIPADRKSIILRISSGPRLVLDKVAIEGANDDDAETMKQYFTGKPTLGEKKEIPYLKNKTEAAAINSVTYLKAQGYWAATGELAPVAVTPTSRKIDLTVKTKPGPLHIITALNLVGTVPPELSDLPLRLQRYLERPATASVLQEIRDGTTAEIRNKGYQFASSFLEAKHKNGQTELTLTLEPGERYLLRRSLLTKEKKTDLSRPQKLFNRLSGKPYDKKEITKLRNSLLATGAFDAIKQERDIDEKGRAIDVTLHLKEGRPKGVSGYLGAGSTEGFILGASYYDRNLHNKLYNFNIAAEITAIGLLGELSVTDPFVFGYDLSATPRAFALTRTFDEYFKIETGVGLTLSYQPTERHTWEADALVSFSSVSPEDLPSSALGVTDYFLTTAGLTWIYDSRDSKVSPTEGFFARVRGEIGAVANDVPNAFFRFESQLSYHLPLNEKNRLGFNLRTGLISPSNSDDLPIDLRYFLGGRDSVRSFPFRELGPSVNGVESGGQAFWYANAEYIRKIAGPIHGVVFFDAGSLQETTASLSDLNTKLALGLGLRIDLPIGPVRFEYGRALNPASGDPSGAFHFSIGTAF